MFTRATRGRDMGATKGELQEEFGAVGRRFGWVFLPSRPGPAQSARMSTLTKKKAPARTAVSRRLAPLSPSARLAARVRAGKFAEGIDIKKVIAVVESRSSARLK